MGHRGWFIGLILAQVLGASGLAAAMWTADDKGGLHLPTAHTQPSEDANPEAAALPMLQARGGPAPSTGNTSGALSRAADTLRTRLKKTSDTQTDADARAAIEILAIARLDAEVELALQQGRYRFRWRDLGAEIVAADDEQARHRMADDGFLLRTAPLETVPATFGLRGARARAVLGGLALLVDRAPIEARWDFVTKRLVPHRAGLTLDVDASLRALHQGLIEGRPSVALVVRENIPQARVDAEPLASWIPTERVAVFRTKYDARKVDRTHNLKLAAKALNGSVLMPGQTLSYNAVVGERTLERGYREAPVIVHGEMLEGVGGGACQVSSTLYSAALFSGLDIVERASHTLPSTYVDKGFDAVVAWPHLDLKIRNSFSFPIALRAFVTDHQVVIELHGSQPGPRVVIRRETTEKIPFVERIEVTAEYKPKQVRKIREGHYGYRISKGRIRWDGSTEHFERLPEDTYQPRPRQVRIGPETLYPDAPLDSPNSAGDDDALSVED